MITIYLIDKLIEDKIRFKQALLQCKTVCIQRKTKVAHESANKKRKGKK